MNVVEDYLLGTELLHEHKPEGFLGYFTTATDLTTKFATANVGDWAIVTETNRVWTWSESWTDSGTEPSQGSSTNEIADLERLYNSSTVSNYTEPVYDSAGNITNKDVWETSAKLVKLYSQTRTYGTDDTSIEYEQLIAKTTTDEVNNKTLTETRAYKELEIAGFTDIVIDNTTKVIT